LGANFMLRSTDSRPKSRQKNRPIVPLSSTKIAGEAMLEAHDFCASTTPIPQSAALDSTRRWHATSAESGGRCSARRLMPNCVDRRIAHYSVATATTKSAGKMKFWRHGRPCLCLHIVFLAPCAAYVVPSRHKSLVGLRAMAPSCSLRLRAASSRLRHSSAEPVETTRVTIYDDDFEPKSAGSARGQQSPEWLRSGGRARSRSKGGRKRRGASSRRRTFDGSRVARGAGVAARSRRVTVPLVAQLRL
jgi:hypothetical protein